MGNKYYELSNHLGNVLSVITDRKLANDEYSYSLGSGDYSYDATLPVKYYYTPGTGSYVQTVATDGTNDNYLPDVETYSDYYPFGMLMPGRHSTSESYRYGFNGMEKDDEVKGISGGSYTTMFRQYDPRLGRWMSLDPLMGKYPNLSPYVAFNNNPIFYADPTGLEGDPPTSNGTESHNDVSPDGGYAYHCDESNSANDGWREIESPYVVKGAAATSTLNTYQTPSGQPITIPEGATPYFIRNAGTLSGSLIGFNDGGSMYISKIENGIFQGYETQNIIGSVLYEEDPNSDYSGILDKVQLSSGAIAYVSEGAASALEIEVIIAVGVRVGVLSIPLLLTSDTRIKGRVGDGSIDIPKPVADEGSFDTYYLYTLRATVSGQYDIYVWGKKEADGKVNLNYFGIWKIGETKNPDTRYSGPWLKSNNLEMFIELQGSRLYIKTMEALRLIEYFYEKGDLPPGNKMFK